MRNNVTIGVVMFDFSDIDEFIVDVVFTKDDGYLKFLRCTRNRKNIPINDRNYETKDDDNHLEVYDVRDNVWTSFNKNMVHAVETLKS